MMRGLLIAFGSVLLLNVYAGNTADEPVPAKKNKVHYFTGLFEVQPVIQIGRVTLHSTYKANKVTPSYVRVNDADTTIKTLAANYYGSFKGSVGYGYKHFLYVGIGTGVQFGRNLAINSNRKVDQVLVPVFAEARISYGKKLQAFYQQDLGYIFFFDQMFKRKDTITEYDNLGGRQIIYRTAKPWGGVLMQSLIGVKYDLKNIGLSFSTGYQLLYLVLPYQGIVNFNVPVYGGVGEIRFSENDRRLQHYLLFSFGVSF